MIGGRRYASYILAGAERLAPQEPNARPTRSAKDRVDEILALLTERSELSLGEIAQGVGLSKTMTSQYLERLIASGQVEATAPPRSRRRRYRLTEPPEGTLA